MRTIQRNGAAVAIGVHLKEDKKRQYATAIRKSEFVRNHVSNVGGAVYVEDELYGDEYPLQIDECVFESNYVNANNGLTTRPGASQGGGAVYVDANSVTILS